MTLDIKDRKILNELDKDCRQSASKIARKTRMSKEVVNYRINRMASDGTIKRFFCEIDTSKLGYVAYKLCFQFQNLTRAKEKELISYLENHPKIAWVAVCSGRWDLIAVLWARDVFEMDMHLSGFLNVFSRYILTKQVITNLQYYIYSRKWLTNDMEPKITCIGRRPSEAKIDETDIEILKILTKNGKAPIVEISRQLGISDSLAIHRIKELAKKGVITAFRIDMDLERLGMEFCKSFIYLQNKTTEKEKELISFCSVHSNITALTQTVGPWDLELELETGSFEQFHQIMRDLKNRFPNLIRSYESVLISRETGITYIPK